MASSSPLLSRMLLHRQLICTTRTTTERLSSLRLIKPGRRPFHSSSSLFLYTNHHYHHHPWLLLRQSSFVPAFFLRTPQKGTGFDNFIPKKDNDDASKESNSDQGRKEGKPKEDPLRSEKQTSDEESSSSSKQGGGGGGGGGGPKGGRDYDDWITAGTLLVIACLLMLSSSEDDTNSSRSGGDSSASSSSHSKQHSSPHHQSSSREITWHELLRLLQQRDVVKIVVTSEKESARVYVKPNAIGLAGAPPPRTTTGGSSVTAEPQHDGFHDQEQDQVEGLGDDSGVISSSTSSAGRGHNTTPFYYTIRIGSIDSFERTLDAAQRAMGRDPSADVPVQYTPDSTVGREVMATIPGLIMAAALFAMMRFASGGVGASGGGRGGMGGIFQIGKSTARKIAKEDVNVAFKDVAGCDEAKKEIMEFVDFLKDSDRFTKLGAKIPKGALLCGPPGTGKTLLAKAVAGEAEVPFYTISGSDFIEMFVGVGPSRVRDLFNEARQNAPCIIFIDEIDAVGRQRGRGGIGGNDERENTLNQLLVEMDGFEPSTGVVVLAGTNRVDILDQALTRPGRFDRQITIDKPDLKGRKEIFKVHLQGITLDHDIDDVAGRLAGLTPGFAGADIANICNEAAIVAARRKAESVTLDDFEKATDRIIGGLESNKIMSKEERSIVAHHEAGHAVAGWFLENADPLLKVTIIPRTSGALGFAQYLPKEVFLRTQDQIMDIVCMALAGRASEEIFFGRVTTGASDDLKRVTDLVYSTIQLYGMNPRLGQLSFPKDPNAMFEERPYSEKTAKAMDEEARAIVDGAYQRTLDLLREKKEDVEKVAKMLLDKETITHDDIIEVIGPRPFKGDPAYEEFIQRRKKDKVEHGEAVEEKDESTVTDESDALNPGLA